MCVYCHLITLLRLAINAGAGPVWKTRSRSGAEKTVAELRGRQTLLNPELPAKSGWEGMKTPTPSTVAIHGEAHGP